MKSNDFASKATQNNYEITMMTLKGEAFAGFKIQRYIDGFLFCNCHCKCYSLNVHWFAETVYKVNNSRYA